MVVLSLPVSLSVVVSSGGIDGESLQRMIEMFVKEIWPDISAERPVLFIIDGHNSRLQWVVIKWCRENHVFILLGVPETTNFWQGMDTCNFGLLEPLWLKWKHAKLLQLKVESCGKWTSLKKEHMVPALRRIYPPCFTKHLNQKGFAVAGLIPFSRCLLRHPEIMKTRVGHETTAGGATMHGTVVTVAGRRVDTRAMSFSSRWTCNFDTDAVIKGIRGFLTGKFFVSLFLYKSKFCRVFPQVRVWMLTPSKTTTMTTMMSMQTATARNERFKGALCLEVLR